MNQASSGGVSRPLGEPSTGNAAITLGSWARSHLPDVARCLDPARLLIELLARNIYWRCPSVRRIRRRILRLRQSSVQECTREDLRTHLRAIGVAPGALVLLHTRIAGVRICSNASSPENYGATANMLLSDVLDLLGTSGTLAMPTNAKYQKEALEDDDLYDGVISYDPLRSVCAVGLVNELFRRQNGVKRSLCPHNMLAVRGPLADELLQDNLNERRPSPHGVDSGYYRICRHNGLMVSIGVPLRDCFTLAHVVEEVRTDWPIKDFLAEQRYQVVQDGMAKEWTIRQQRPEYGKFCCCRRKMARDMVAEGVLHEGRVDTVRVDWAWAGEVYDFFWRKTEKRPYPYYGLWLSRIPWRKEQ